MRRLLPTTLATLLLTGAALAAVPLPPATTADVTTLQRTLHNDLYSLGQGIIAAVKAQSATPDPSARLDAIAAKLDAILAQLRATPAATGTAVAGGTAIAPTTDVYFPADPGRAQFPSPENTSIIRLGAKVSGAPYERDKRGSVHQLGDIHPPLSGYYINSVELHAYSDVTAAGLLMRGGEAYVQLSSGQWQKADPNMGNGLYNTGLPDAAAAVTTATGTQTAAAPVTITPSAVPPGSTGHVLLVGKDCNSLSDCIKMAVPGDTIDGANTTVMGTAPFIPVSAELRNFVMDCSSGAMTQGKGCLVNGADVIYRNIKVSGAARNPNVDTGVGCIRAGAPSTVTIIGSEVFDCVQGVGGGGFPWNLVATDTHVHDNGLGDGQTHNFYITQEAISVTLTRVVSDHPRGGHAFKSRAAAFTATDSTFSADETLIDLPNGTSSVANLNNITLIKTPGSGNHRLIGYGEEGATVGTAGVLATGGTVTGLESPFIQGSGTVMFKGTTIVGTKPVGQGVTVVGP